MNLLKLEKQLVADLTNKHPNGLYHSAEIKVNVYRGSYKVDIYAYVWAQEPLVEPKLPPLVNIFIHEKKDLKAAVAEFYSKLHGIDNKLELDEVQS